MQRRNTTALIGVAAIALFFFVLDPLGLFRPQSALTRPRSTAQQMSALSATFERNAKPPRDYVVSAFDSHDIVFLGEMGQIREQVDFVAALIPDLYRNGVRTLGLEYALSADQAKIDRVLNAPAYDEKSVESILFDRMVLWGFKEYADIFRAAWQLNRTLPAVAPPFRIIGLNVRTEYQYLKEAGDATNPEIVKKVFAEGVPDLRMAETIEREIVATRTKALIFTTIQHAFTRFRYKDYAEKSRKSGVAEGRSAGNIVRDRIGDRAITVLLHSPWPDAGSPGGMSYPAGGRLDAFVAENPNGESPAGLTVVGNAVGEIPVTNQSYSYGYSGLTLADMTTGYIILGPISAYHAVTPIPDFIDSTNVATAVQDFPGPNIDARTSAADLNRFIARMSETVGQSLARFR